MSARATATALVAKIQVLTMMGLLVAVQQRFPLAEAASSAIAVGRTVRLAARSISLR